MDKEKNTILNKNDKKSILLLVITIECMDKKIKDIKL